MPSCCPVTTVLILYVGNQLFLSEGESSAHFQVSGKFSCGFTLELTTFSFSCGYARDFVIR